MSAWTIIEGTCVSKKVSIKKIISCVLDGEDFVANYHHDKFDVRFESDGENAAKSISQIIKSAKDFDKNCQIEIYAQIPYFA